MICHYIPTTPTSVRCNTTVYVILFLLLLLVPRCFHCHIRLRQLLPPQWKSDMQRYIHVENIVFPGDIRLQSSSVSPVNCTLFDFVKFWTQQSKVVIFNITIFFIILTATENAVLYTRLFYSKSFYSSLNVVQIIHIYTWCSFIANL